MAILTGWSRLLQYKKSKNIVIVDEKPICILASLYTNQSAALGSKEANAWWKSMYKKWSEVLDLIVYLDTNELALIKRIRAREMWQEVKILSDEDAIR